MGRRKKVSEMPQQPAVPEWPTAIYARLSIENSKKDDHGESIEGQIDICRAYVEEHPYLHLAETYVDNGWTGTNTNRPAFQLLLQDIEVGRIRALVIKDFSRFSRDYIEAGNLLENFFPVYNVRFISVVDNYDSFETDGSAESLLIPLKNLINDFYSRDMSRKVCTAIHAKQLAGEHIPSMIPYGYRKSTTAAYRYEPDPETAPVVKRIFQMRVDGIAIGQIARTLQGEAIPSPGKLRFQRGLTVNPVYENAQWTPRGVKNILQNPTYPGDLVFGRMPVALYQGKADQAYEYDESRWRVLKDMHEPLVTREVFEQVKAMAAANTEQWKQTMLETEESRKQNIPLFRDCIYCGDCGSHMIYKRKHSGITGSYYCPNVRLKRCEKHSIAQEKLKDIVWQSIQIQIALFYDYDKIPKLLEEGQNTAQQEEYQREMQSLQVKMNHRAGQREKLYENFADGILTPEEYTFMKKRYDKEYLELRAQINMLQERMTRLKQTLSTENEWLTHIRSFAEAGEFMPEMLSALVEKVLVYQDAAGKKRVEIQYKYTSDFEALQEASQELREDIA